MGFYGISSIAPSIPYGQAWPGVSRPKSDFQGSSPAKNPSSIEQSNSEGGFSRLKTAQRIYHYVAPMTALSLFSAGFAASLALPWFIKGLSLPSLKQSFSKFTEHLQSASGQSPMNELAKETDSHEVQMGLYYTESLLSALMFAKRNPGIIQDRVKAYLGTSVLGYILGSFASGLQEVLIRKEETQIRADLLNQMTQSFRQSIRNKSSMDSQLREYAKRRIASILSECRIPEPMALLEPAPDIAVDRTYRYPYEPTHFDQPYSTPQPSAYRFGSELNPPSAQPMHLTPSVGAVSMLKALFFAAGLVSGGLGQILLFMLKGGMAHAEPVVKAADEVAGKSAKKIFFRIFNAMNFEALMLGEEAPFLITVLAVIAASKLGKMLIDGYREIEITRQNAGTELRYQEYNWLYQDPQFHRIAEEEALEDALNQLRAAIPYEWNNRKALSDRIKTILANIGRNSAPKYFQMTPMVNLVAARS